MLFRILLVASAVAMAQTGLAAAKEVSSRVSQTRPVVIAIVGEAGANVLHEDFAVSGGSPALPAAAPPRTLVRLPNDGSFEARLAAAKAGPLGRLPSGQLLQLAGTQILVYNAELQPTDIFADRSHGTAVLGAAASIRSGSAPSAIYVFVLGNGRAWDWVAQQSWIDVATTSVNTPVGGGAGRGPVADVTCAKGAGVRRAVAEGKLVLSAGGNGDPSWHVSAPAALPEVLRVGGHNADGSSTPLPTRPYEVSDLFVYASPDPNALTGTKQMIGTSFAAPRAAGRAALLIGDSRRILGDSGDSSGTGLARKGRGASTPAIGPLTDGVLTNAELRSLLQDTATPTVDNAETRYALEGFGQLGEAQMNLSGKILRGTAPAPDRATERSQHSQVQSTRALVTHPARCG